MPWNGQSLARPDRQLLERRLPEELAGRFAERHDDAAVAGLLGIAQQLVVRADEHDAAADDRVAVASASRARPPTSRSCPVLTSHVVGRPVIGETMLRLGRAAPHRPVGRSAGVDAPMRTAGDEQEIVLIDCDRRSGDSLSMLTIGSCKLSGCRSRCPKCRRRRCPGRLRDGAIVSIFSMVHAAGSASPGGHTLPRTRAVPSARFVDPQLHPVPRVGVPRERHAHRHLVGGLPGMQLELLAVAEQHEAVALVDEPDVAALRGASRGRARPPPWCSSTSSAGP